MARPAPQVVDYQQLMTKCILIAFFSCAFDPPMLLYIYESERDKDKKTNSFY